MILVDTALRAREHAGNPIRVGMIGAAFSAVSKAVVAVASWLSAVARASSATFFWA